MIVEWLVSLAAGLWGWFAGLLPDWELPAELTNPDGMLASIFALGSGAGAFVDWGFVTTVGAIPLAVWAAGLLWKAIRTLVSHIPFFGGN